MDFRIAFSLKKTGIVLVTTKKKEEVEVEKACQITPNNQK
jgi:hypothetical protein